MEKKSSPPKKLNIKGQPHHLAYINDVEDGLLRAMGGSGELVNGIPAFYSEEDEQFEAQAMADFEAEYGGGDPDPAPSNQPTITAAQVAAMNRAQKNLGITPHQAGLTPEERIAQSRFDYADVFAPEIYSSRMVGQNLGSLFDLDTYKNALAGKGLNFGGVRLGSNYMDIPSYRDVFANMAIDRLDDRIAGYKDDKSYLGQRLAPVNTFFANNIRNALKDGGRPVLDSTGRVAGAFHAAPFGLGEVYTGMPVEGVAGTGFIDPAMGGEDVKQPNPLTGQCDEGYVFDEDLQACRVDTGSNGNGNGGGDAASSDGAYYRPTGLESAPANLPAGVDYGALNDQFIDTYAYRPQDFVNPMSLNGFVKV